MNPDIYMMLAQSAQNPEAMTSEGPAPKLPNVPHGTSIRNPLSEGSIAAIHAARESLSSKPPSIGKMLTDSLQNVGIGMMRGAAHPQVQAIGQMFQGPQEREAAQLAENMQLMKYLQEAQQAEQIHSYRQAQLEEQQRHHRATESMYGMHGQSMSPETKMMEQHIYDQTGDKVFAIQGMKTPMQTFANKKIDEYASKAQSSAEILDTAARMKEIAKNNPKILNSWGFIAANKYMEHPNFWNQAAVNMGLSEKEKDALMEMAALTKNLNVNTLKVIPSKGLNQMVERTLFSATTSAKMSEGAFMNTLDRLMESAEHTYSENGKAAEYGRQGFFYRPSTAKAKSKVVTPQQHENMAELENPGANVEPESGNTLDQLKAERARLQEMKAKGHQ